MKDKSLPQTITQGRYLHLLKLGRWEFIHRPDISGIVVLVPITDDGEIILIEQFRPPVQAKVIELPAGLAGDQKHCQNEPLLQAAKRELLEETGYEAESLVFLTEGPPSPGLSDEIVTFFLATRLTKIHSGGGDDTEDIRVHAVPLHSVHQWLETIRQRPDILLDPKTYVGIYFAHRFLQTAKR